MISTTPISRLASRLIVAGAVGIFVAMAQDSSSRAGRSEKSKVSA